MPIRRIAATLLLFAFCMTAHGQTPSPKMTVVGKLTRVMAIGGESTGWAVQFDSHKTVGGKELGSLEVKFTDPKQAENFENKRVKVTGTVTYRHGVETGDQPVLEVTSIKGAKAPKPTT